MRTPRKQRALPRSLGAILAAALLAGAPAAAQYALNQDGRLLDANPEIGGTRYNYSRPVSPLLGGNPFATGNTRFGSSLRSFSPISDPSVFQGGLGSASLSNFIRDSVSVSDAGLRNRAIGGTLFYDPSRTAPSTGFLQGTRNPFAPSSTFNRTPFGTYQNRGVQSNQVTFGGPVDMRLDVPRSERAPLGYPFGTESQELRSAIFGARRHYLPGPLEQLRESDEQTLGGAPRFGLTQEDEEVRVSPYVSPLDARVTPQTPAWMGSRLDLVVQGDPLALLSSPPSRAGLPWESNIQPPAFPADPAAAAAPRPGPTTTPPPTLSVVPGGDRYTDMRMALELEANPQAVWFGEIQEAMRQQPALAQELQEYAALSGEEFVQRILNSTISTFASTGPSHANEQLIQAESDMVAGRYYDAANAYEKAQLLSPGNPLPMIGRGHALLAAGEYASASVQLLRGLGQFEDFGRFRLDLKSLLGGQEIIDVRRSDLMQRLDTHEDPSLRFLLGYIEYHSGQRERGLENMQRAADSVEAPPAVRRYLKAVRGGEGPAVGTEKP